MESHLQLDDLSHAEPGRIFLLEAMGAGTRSEHCACVKAENPLLFIMAKVADHVLLQINARLEELLLQDAIWIDKFVEGLGLPPLSTLGRGDIPIGVLEHQVGALKRRRPRLVGPHSICACQLGMQGHLAMDGGFKSRGAQPDDMNTLPSPDGLALDSTTGSSVLNGGLMEGTSDGRHVLVIAYDGR